MKTKALRVSGGSLLVLVGLAVMGVGCEERVVIRRPAPVVRVYRPVVVQERVIVR
jgi:hypothetical protein